MGKDDYLYAAGVIRHLENKLLNPTDIKRMMDAPDLASAFKVFHDTDYFDNVLDVKPVEFIKALDADLVQAKRKIQEMAPSEELVEFLFMRYDFHNLKLLLKEKYSQSNLSGYLSPLGNESADKLKALINNEKNIDVLRYLKRALAYIQENLPKEASPQAIDRSSDQAFFIEYGQLAKKFGSQWISDLVRLQIDMANLKVFIRSKRLNYEKSELLFELVPGGNVQKDFFVKLLDMPEEEALAGLRLHLPLNARNLLDNYLKTKSLEELERDLENLELDYVRKVKFIDYGPELIIAYYLAKKNAIRNVRLIMTGKLNNINAREIEKRVREIY